MFINNISASKSDIIDECLWKYYLRYVLKIPGFGSKNEGALNFGSFIHKVFELGYKEGDLKALLRIAESERKTYKVPFDLNDRMKACLEHFLIWNQNLGETVSTELPFDIPLDESKDISFRGVIDRIIKGTENGYLVIDYKTSKREKKKKDLLGNKQLMGYAYAVHELYNIPYKDIYCGHYYPVTGNFVTVRFVEWQIKKWKTREIDKVWRIRKKKKDEFFATENLFCDWCEFQKACPKFNSPEIVNCRLEEQKVLRAQLREEKKNS